MMLQIKDRLRRKEVELTSTATFATSLSIPFSDSSRSCTKSSSASSSADEASMTGCPVLRLFDVFAMYFSASSRARASAVFEPCSEVVEATSASSDTGEPSAVAETAVASVEVSFSFFGRVSTDAGSSSFSSSILTGPLVDSPSLVGPDCKLVLRSDLALPLLKGFSTDPTAFTEEVERREDFRRLSAVPYVLLGRLIVSSSSGVFVRELDRTEEGGLVAERRETISCESDESSDEPISHRERGESSGLPGRAFSK